MYIDETCSESHKIDPAIVRGILFNLKKAEFHPDMLHIKYASVVLNQEYQLKALLETYKCRHWQIKSITLHDCGIRDQLFGYFLKELSRFGKKLERLDMTDN